MHPPCEVGLGKFGKGPREGGFTRYFAGIEPAAQLPQPGVDLKAFDQDPRGKNVPPAPDYPGQLPVGLLFGGHSG